MHEYCFSSDWFEKCALKTRDKLIPKIRPKTILEIGSYEGRSTCYLIDKLSADAEIEIHCVDTWTGGIEHQSAGIDMKTIESRFDDNTNISLSNAKNNVMIVKHKGRSDVSLSRMIAKGKLDYFDFVYVDGSHQAPDVLCDAVLAFRLLKVGGFMAFDDYLWAERLPNGKDPLRCPKAAIDAFVNLYIRKLEILGIPLYQLYIQKTSN